MTNIYHLRLTILTRALCGGSGVTYGTTVRISEEPPPSRGSEHRCCRREARNGWKVILARSAPAPLTATARAQRPRSEGNGTGLPRALVR